MRFNIVNSISSAILNWNYKCHSIIDLLNVIDIDKLMLLMCNCTAPNSLGHAISICVDTQCHSMGILIRH